MKGPVTYNVPDNVYYLTVHVQKKLAVFSPFVKQLPWNHFGRKNVGYLWAILHNASYIWDFDDDNKLQRKFPELMAANIHVSMYTKHTNLSNPCLNFGQRHMWPRGFPLSEIKDYLNKSFELSPSVIKNLTLP